MMGRGWQGQLFNILGLARIVHRPCMPEAPVWDFINVPLPLPSGRQTLPLCKWEFGVGSKFLTLPPNGSRSLLAVISEPGPTLYLPEADACLLPFPSSGRLLPKSGMVGWGKGERRGSEFCPFQHQMLFLEGMEEFPAPLPLSGFAFLREASEKQVGFVLCTIFRALLCLFPAVPLLFLISAHWGLWRNVGECGFLFVSGIPGGSTLNGHQHMAFKFVNISVIYFLPTFRAPTSSSHTQFVSH